MKLQPIYFVFYPLQLIQVNLSSNVSKVAVSVTAVGAGKAVITVSNITVQNGSQPVTGVVR